MTGTIKLIRIILLMVIQQGGDDVSCKPRIHQFHEASHYLRVARQITVKFCGALLGGKYCFQEMPRFMANDHITYADTIRVYQL